jgi:hypothetical protein
MKKLIYLILILVNNICLAQNCQKPFISEYVEGWANNKAIEIYNPTNSTIDLSNYKIARYADGSVSSSTVQLTGMIGPYQVHVAVLDKRNANGTGSEAPVWDSLQSKADNFYCPIFASNPTLYFSGNDAIALLEGNTIIDIFGKIGENPSDESGNPTNNSGGWSTISPFNTGLGVIVTKDHSLVRKSNILNGVTLNPAIFNALQDWDSIPPVKIRIGLNGDTIYSPNGNIILDGNWATLGYHECSCDPFFNYNPIITNYNLTSCSQYVKTNGDVVNYNSQFIDVFQNINGCDSILLVNFTYSPIVVNTDIICCDSYYVLTSGVNVFNSGLYFDTLSTGQGCDTVFIINLLFNQPLSNSIFDTICGGPYSWNGVTYNTSGNYTQTFQAQNGCDSVVTLHLTVFPNNFNPTFSSSQQLFTNPPFAIQFSNTTTNPSNYNFTWYWGDGTSTTSNNATVFHEYLTNGLYTVTLEATSVQTGCFDETTLTDYIYTTGGVSCTHSAIINQTGPISACSGQGVVLSCNYSPTYSYQWRRNGVYISGNNNDSLLVTQPGAYSVIISDNGCPVSSSQVTVNFSTIAAPVISSNGSIQPCVGGSVTLSTTAGFTSYLWSNGATTPSTNVTSSGSYTVQVTNSSGCSATSNPFTINASILPTQNICVVGVDSLTNNIRVVWEKPITSAIDSFYVYRETSVSNVYSQVGARPYDSLSVWLDPIANPAVQAYRYKLTALDTCGSETPLSNFHKTIHLTINQGVGNAWNLIWSNYEGISFGSYNIYRGTTLNNLSLLTSIQSNLNSYTDLSAPSGNVYYQIEIVNPNNCVPTKSINYSISKSNIVNTNSSSIDEINESNITVYPNPANELLIIESGILLNSKFRIIDAIGRTVYQGFLSSSKNSLDISSFSRGTYTLIVENLGKPVRFVKQ